MSNFLFILLLFLIGCSNNTISSKKIFIADLKNNKKEYDESLVNRENGMHRIFGMNEKDSTFGIVLVHGYYPETWKEKGLEWVNPIFELSKVNVPLWFFKYDWENCPENSADSLYFELKNMISNNSHLDSLWVLGHSLGGVVTSLFAENWTDDLPISVHSIAAPLTGMKKFKDNHCRLTEKETYTIRDQIKYSQWKTVKEQDGAFKQLEFDPQNALIKGGKVITLPGTWKDNRLGHNKSILWVCEKITKEIT